MSKATLVMGSMLFALGALELALRTIAPSHLAGSTRRFELDPDLIYRLRPRATVTWSSAEFTETSHTNSIGLRGGEIDPGSYGERILAIGDSFTYGHGVQDDETYPAVLERRLRASGRDVVVLNAGVPGYSTDQSYAYFLREGAALHPDLVLVGIHCSDISDNYESPLFDVIDGTLVRRDARRSRMYRLGSILDAIPALVQESRIFDTLVASFDWHDGAPERPAVADLDAWSRAKIRLEVRDLEARGTATHTAIAAVLMPCKKTLAGEVPDPYGDLASDLSGAGVPVIDAAPAMRRIHGDLAALFFRDDPHLNAGGYEALAEVVASVIEDRVPQTPSDRYGLRSAGTQSSDGFVRSTVSGPN